MGRASSHFASYGKCPCLCECTHASKRTDGNLDGFVDGFQALALFCNPFARSFPATQHYADCTDHPRQAVCIALSTFSELSSAWCTALSCASGCIWFLSSCLKMLARCSATPKASPRCTVSPLFWHMVQRLMRKGYKKVRQQADHSCREADCA